MSWVIAILLALILVALMGSDKSASAAVKKVLKASALVALLMAFAVAVLAFLVWFHLVWAKEDWWQTGPVVGIAFLWLAAGLTQFKEIAKRLQEHTWSTLVQVGKAVGLIALFLIFGYYLKELSAELEVSGWWLIAMGILLPGLLLLVRTMGSPRAAWRDIWFDPKPLPTAWEAVQQAHSMLDAEEEALFQQEEERWHDLDSSQREAVLDARSDRLAARRDRLNEIERDARFAKAEEEAKRPVWTVAGAFWTFVVLGALGLVPLCWRIGFAWAMTFEAVKGREWLAGLLVALGGLAVLGVTLSVWDDYLSRTRRKGEVANTAP